MKRLRSWIPGLWFVESDIRMMPGVFLPVRMTVLRLSDGGLWIHSPVEIDDALAVELAAIGQVKYLVSPNLFHHLFLGTAQKRYPQALVFAPQGLAQKRPDLRIDRVWDNALQTPWGDQIEHLCMGGMPQFHETVFYHPKTESLITTDLVFHLQEIHGWMGRLMFRLLGTYKRFKVSPFFIAQIKDKAAFGKSCKELFGWAFSRVIMAHGEPIDQQAEERLRQALARWL